MDYKVPGVFVEEISTLPPSVAPVATAVPAFVGYTEKALNNDGSSYPDDEIIVRRVDTLLEFKQYFGSNPKFVKFKLEFSGGQYGLARKTTDDKDANTLHSHLMYYALNMYFKNGGGSCYIVSVGRYEATASKANALDPVKIENGIDKVKEFDEPTLLVPVDAVNLDPAGYYAACVQILDQCNLMKDRFGIFDVLEDDLTAINFRERIGSKYLKYAAAYTPYLQTSISYRYKEEDVDISAAFWKGKSGGNSANGLEVSYSDLNYNLGAPTVVIASGDTSSVGVIGNILNITVKTGITLSEVKELWDNFDNSQKGGFSIEVLGDGSTELKATAKINPKNSTDKTLDSIQNTHTHLYNQLKSLLIKQRVVLPPSSSMAGIYASVDRDRGVWKAPANISLSSVIGPIKKITNAQQSNLNVDVTSGKSINVIRSFAGRGTLVWGGRTLAGNDNEWRYVNVRRLFNYVEESIQKSTAFAVFEPNTATTWLKVKGMIESFLYGLWQQGALAGSTPEAAYTVNIGLGKTMTPQDVLEGRLIVEIGIAAVRPAEFIILRFMHQLQQA